MRYRYSKFQKTFVKESLMLSRNSGGVMMPTKRRFTGLLGGNCAYQKKEVDLVFVIRIILIWLC
jgi:hypothetical protein